MRRALQRDNRGLTLLELIVGVTILAIITVPLLHVFVTGAATEAKTRRYSAATNAAQSLTEQVQALDTGRLLADASVFNPSAQFYSAEAGGFVPTGPTAPNGPVYYLGIADYSYGGALYDALITLNAADAVNEDPVVVGNQMDAALDLTGADAAALSALLAECGSLMENSELELSAESLSRSIRLRIAAVSGEPGTYRVAASFDYSATIAATHERYDFQYSENAAAVVKNVPVRTDGEPIFSVFLFYDAFYKSSLTYESLTVENPTGADVNIFLVNTSKAPMPALYRAELRYAYQRFEGESPVNHLVYTNLAPGSLIYRAESGLYTKTFPITSDDLVEKEARERRFAVRVTLFEGGSGFSGTPLLEFDSTKLSY